jgi:hypothetical protein
MKILFIGNSYTFFHKMPEEIFAPMARAEGIDLDVTSVTRGGWYLRKFADPEGEEGKRLRAEIEGKGYDCIILQEQSCNPVVDKEDFLVAVRAMKALLSPHTAHFVLYSTWGRCQGSEKLSELGLSSAEMTDRLSAAYNEAGCDCGMTVAEVGLAFRAYGAENDVTALYDPDLSHPSQRGSEIAARVILDAVKKELAI